MRDASFVARDTTRVLTPLAFNIWGIDFDDFGLPAGQVQSSIFLRGVTGNAPEILAVAAVNGAPVAPAPVPLPASLAFLLSALGLGAMMRRRHPG